MSDLELYHQLSYYTLSLGDEEFIHQLIVDTFAAQHYEKSVKPITITFALVGLYLVCEKNFTGKQVQNIHVALARKNQSKNWPTFSVPNEKASITIQDVIDIPDDEKEEMIKKWCCAVWEIWHHEKQTIANLLADYLEIV